MQWQKKDEDGVFWTPDEASEALLAYFNQKYASLTICDDSV